MAEQTLIPDVHRLVVEGAEITLHQADKDNTALLIAVGATIVSFLSVCVAFYQATSSRKQVREQLEQAAKHLQDQLNAGREQFFMGVRSSNRQRWVDELREEIADLMAACTVAFRLVLEIVRKQLKGGLTQEAVDALNSQIRTLRREIESLNVRIALRLNPAEEAHRSLLTHVTNLRRVCFNSDDKAPKEFCDSAPARRTDFEAHRTSLLEIAKAVLKSEWERVKRGE